MRRILFLCTGNVCRSPMAEGIFQHLAKERGKSFDVISAGFSPKLENLPYHPLATEVCGQNGIELFGNAKLATRELISSADYIFALDFGNLNSIFSLDETEEFFSKIHYLRTFSSFPAKDLSIPDPMGKAKSDFENSFKIIHDCCSNLMDRLSSPLPRSDALTLAEMRREESQEDYLFRLEAYKSFQKSVKQKDCLVIGCEDGAGVNILAKNARKVLAVDTRLNKPDLFQNNVEFRQLRYGAIRTIELQFDFVFCFHVLDYLFTQRAPHFLESIRSMMKDGGIAFFLIKRNITEDQFREMLLSFFPYVHIHENSIPKALIEKLSLGFFSFRKSPHLLAVAGTGREEFEQTLRTLSFPKSD